MVEASCIKPVAKANPAYAELY